MFCENLVYKTGIFRWRTLRIAHRCLFWLSVRHDTRVLVVALHEVILIYWYVHAHVPRHLLLVKLGYVLELTRKWYGFFPRENDLHRFLLLLLLLLFVAVVHVLAIDLVFFLRSTSARCGTAPARRFRRRNSAPLSAACPRSARWCGISSQALCTMFSRWGPLATSWNPSPSPRCITAAWERV